MLRFEAQVLLHDGRVGGEILSVHNRIFMGAKGSDARENALMRQAQRRSQ